MPYTLQCRFILFNAWRVLHGGEEFLLLQSRGLLWRIGQFAGFFEEVLFYGSNCRVLFDGEAEFSRYLYKAL